MSNRRTIGILGGLGPESTIEYYSYITRKYYELYSDYAYPEIVIYSLSFKPFIDAGYELPDQVKEAFERLSKAGADFVVASCNSLHIVYDEIARNLPIPWVSIMDATAEEIKLADIECVGLLGTVFTMGNGFYHRTLARHGIDIVTPVSRDQERVNSIIFDELIRAITNNESRQFVLGCIERMRQKGAEGIILGCTELPFLIKQEDADLRIFDTTVIHAQKALDLALEG